MALPAGMKMEVNFIDQNDAFAFKRIIRFWIRYRHPTCEISYHCERTFFSIGELVDDELFSVLDHYHAQWPTPYFESSETTQEAFDCCSYRLKLSVTEFRVVYTRLVLQILTFPEPFEEDSEAAPFPRQSLVVSRELIK